MLRRRRATNDQRPTTIERQNGGAADGLLRRLHWKVLRPLASALGGNERSLLYGPGLELDEVRAYQPGDDVRLIDWNITARTDEPYVRQSRVERALDVWLLVDLSPSVDWGTALRLKRDIAVEMTAVAGQLLGQHGNRVGALLFADEPLAFVPPAAGRTQLLRLISAVRDQPRRAQRGRTDLAAAVRRAEAMIQRRSLVLVISDFIVPDGWQADMQRFAQRHEVVAVQLADPRERELPNVGTITLEDPETGRQLTVNTGDRRLRERFQQAAQAQAEQLHAMFIRYGVDQVTLDTSEELLPALVRFLKARQRKRAAAR